MVASSRHSTHFPSSALVADRFEYLWKCTSAVICGSMCLCVCVHVRVHVRVRVCIRMHACMHANTCCAAYACVLRHRVVMRASVLVNVHIHVLHRCLCVNAYPLSPSVCHPLSLTDARARTHTHTCTHTHKYIHAFAHAHRHAGNTDCRCIKIHPTARQRWADRNRYSTHMCHTSRAYACMHFVHANAGVASISMAGLKRARADRLHGAKLFMTRDNKKSITVICNHVQCPVIRCHFDRLVVALESLLELLLLEELIALGLVLRCRLRTHAHAHATRSVTARLMHICHRRVMPGPAHAAPGSRPPKHFRRIGRIVALCLARRPTSAAAVGGQPCHAQSYCRVASARATAPVTPAAASLQHTIATSQASQHEEAAGFQL